ncbi:hypothetical protein RvY_00850-2 [Ramazzottius varieornatus]|uniref:Angiotensin-converting enzyme n=1 Tax=Ramazzottius varieornatus TaxID=947166 RepID=A0A1D1UHV8_RAMVA|nr:hypothetical protein RvY_00850-2 [Ramazzottius varieornatus]
MIFRILLGSFLVFALSLVHAERALPQGIRSPAKREVRATAQDFFDYIHKDYQPRAEKLTAEDVEASWKFNTNITAHNEQEMIASSEKVAKFDKEIATYIRANFKDVDFSANATLKRVRDKLVLLGDANLPDAEFSELQTVEARMKNIYSTAKVCKTIGVHADDVEDKCPKEHQLELEPGITQLIQNSRDEPLLKHLWKSWRDATGRHMKHDYARYVVLKNKGAQMDGYADNGAAWRSTYVEPDLEYLDQNFIDEAEGIWQQLKPLYEQLHAYVRHSLQTQYPTVRGLRNPKGPIPAHLLGNMWAQQWSNLQDFSRPHPDKPSLDVTPAMVEKNYTANGMFHMSDDFFASLGLIRMPGKFWDHSMLSKPDPKERLVVCHASAWDFYNREDFRIKQCTDIRMKDFITVHHEMGHVEYFLQYKDQWIPFRDGANDGFHEAVGDTLALSVSTPGHLEKLGLLKNYNSNDKDAEINFMFSTALEKIAFLPFGLVMDMYRYDVFNGKIKTTELNAQWWKYVNKYQGICSPVGRSEDDFDPGAKYHTAADVPYMRYFVSFVIQFQFHEALCNAAGHKGELHTCDIDSSKAAGKLMADALSLGSSEPWQVAMKKLTGQEKMDAGPLMKFFKPLQDWLRKENDRRKQKAGWSDDVTCTGSRTIASVLALVALFVLSLLR